MSKNLTVENSRLTYTIALVLDIDGSCGRSAPIRRERCTEMELLVDATLLGIFRHQAHDLVQIIR